MFQAECGRRGCVVLFSILWTESHTPLTIHHNGKEREFPADEHRRARIETWLAQQHVAEDAVTEDVDELVEGVPNKIFERAFRED